MDEVPEVDDPAEVTEILRAMKEQYFSIMELDKNRERDYSFEVHLVPAFFPSSGSFEVINNFNLILEGACALRDQGSNKNVVVSIIELVVDKGNGKSHSYIITPLNFKGTSSSSGPGYYAYAFIEPAASGYAGTGPSIQRSIQNCIDDHIPKVRQKVINVSSISSFEGLFYERGPVVNVFFPRFEIHIGLGEYDERFVDA
ncbi:hypothetical protein Thermo_01645 [Thermoplasmatales archaeon]|nr:hypothetical protein Thermo_01645 [Thermoplasmatales archaeon]